MVVVDVVVIVLLLLMFVFVIVVVSFHTYLHFSFLIKCVILLLLIRFDTMLMLAIYCGYLTNVGLLGSVSVVSRGSTVRHPVITNSRRVTVTTKLGQLS